MASSTVQFLVVASAAALLTHATPAADCEVHPEAVLGSSFVQSGKATLVAGVASIAEDPFGDLEDAFDTPKATMKMVSDDLSNNVQVNENAKYWCTFFLDLAIFGVVVSGVQKAYAMRKDAKKGKKAPKVVETFAAPKEAPQRQEPVSFQYLMEAARNGDEASWRRLLAEIPNLKDAKDACGCTALHVAAASNSTGLAQELLSRGAAVNAKEAWEETPLHIAARSGSLDVCKLLLAHGAELDAMDLSDRTPLLSAAFADHASVCDYLLDQGAGCGGASDEDLPVTLCSLLAARVAKPLTVTPSDSDVESDY